MEERMRDTTSPPRAFAAESGDAALDVAGAYPIQSDCKIQSWQSGLKGYTRVWRSFALNRAARSRQFRDWKLSINGYRQRAFPDLRRDAE
jgi:hypothetical protein